MNDSLLRTNKNALRFKWHEKVLEDREITKRAGAITLAGIVMHRFNVDNGFAQFSINDVVRKYHMDRSTVMRCRKLLITRGWLQIYERPIGPGGWHLTLRYTLGGGPEDLLLDGHNGTGAT